MEVFEAIKQRYSCRAYKQEPVAKEKLLKVLDAARLAPSAHNAQNWKLIVVDDLTKKQGLAQVAGQMFIAQAPIIIVGVSLQPDEVMSCGVETYAVDSPRPKFRKSLEEIICFNAFE